MVFEYRLYCTINSTLANDFYIIIYSKLDCKSLLKNARVRVHEKKSHLYSHIQRYLGLIFRFRLYTISRRGQRISFYLMTNSIDNPFPKKPLFLRVHSINLLKTLWAKERLLITSNFSLCHGVFNPFGELSTIFIEVKIVVCKLFEFVRVKYLSFGKAMKNVSFMDPNG